MLVSIIVPVYNEASTLPRFLTSLRRIAEADGQQVEVIFVDGGSDDESPRMVRCSGFGLVASERGRAAQMNAGARLARGELLLFLHADTLLPAGALARLRSAVEAGAIGGWFDVRLDSRLLVHRIVGRMISWRSRLTGVASGDQGIFVTREAFAGLGGYAAVPLFEDIDLVRRLRRLGPVVSLRPPVVTSPRRWQRWGTWRTIFGMWALRLLYYSGVSPERLARYYPATR